MKKKTNRIGYSEKIKLNVISRLTSVTPSCGLVTMAWATVRLKKDNDYDDDDDDDDDDDGGITFETISWKKEAFLCLFSNLTTHYSLPLLEALIRSF